MTKNQTYLQNPSYPASYTITSDTTCTYTFSKITTSVCQVWLAILIMFSFISLQIRLDFEQFEMGPPISNNVVSYFYVSLQPPCYRIFLILYHNTGSAIIIICCIKRCVDTGTVTDYVSLVHSAGTTTRTEPTHLCGYNTGYHGM